MKATTYEPSPGGQNTTRCDTEIGVTNVTPKPKREKMPLTLITREIYQDVTATDGVTNAFLLGVTYSRDGHVTAMVSVNGDYAKRLSMSKKKIRTIWLTIERIAELKGCSVRTAWRYVEQHGLQTYKQMVESGKRKIYKTFIMTDLHLYTLEIKDCQSKASIPGTIFEISIEINGKPVNSALILSYAPITHTEADNAAV